MLNFTPAVERELARRDKHIIPVVEIYPRETEDITSIGAPANALARFAAVCFDWANSTGTYRYEAKVTSFPAINMVLGEEIGEAEVELSNVSRGDDSAARFLLNNRIKGCWMVIRLVFPDAPEDSVIVFWGKCERPGRIDSKRASLRAVQESGNLKQEIPFRNYQVACPLEFARTGGACLGNQTLAEKNLSYRENFALYGTSGCNKRFSTCVLLGNDRFFQGQRVVAVSGQFSYITVEEVVKRVLFWTKRKKIQTVKTDSWSSVNQSEGNEIIPLAFGRCQIQGHPFTWADQGTQVKALMGFCEGRISAFSFIRSRTEGITLSGEPIQHLGDLGGTGTQLPDTLFNGVSGYNSGLAYLEVTVDGSSPTQVDDAPIVTAVIRGLEVPLPGPDGTYSDFGWTNNPVHYTRFLLTDTRFGRIPLARIDDQVALATAADCDAIVEDRTNDEAVVLPANEYDNYGLGYRRFRSTGRYTAYRYMYEQGLATPAGTGGNSLVPPPDEYPEFEDPQVRWFNPFEPYVLPRNEVVLRQKFTFNGALQEKTSMLDFLQKRVLPTFKGYIVYGPNGKIQIKNRRPADNAYLRDTSRPGALRVPVTTIDPWRYDRSGYLLIGVSLETAEIREVNGFSYSSACNGLALTTTDTGSVSSTTSTEFAGGSAATAATAWIDFAGTVTAGAKVEAVFGTGDEATRLSYLADGVEDLEGFARMFAAFMNANPWFRQTMTAWVSDDRPHRIQIRCNSGYLLIDEPLEYEHQETEEVLRVVGVFENCQELTANRSARFDNIIAESFSWNDNDSEEINAVAAKYTSAIDDFHLTNILPRAAWDTVNLEGELNKDEMDLTFVDNYWQAAYLAKSRAIEIIDGNLTFSWDTGCAGMRLELGDVVAVRHDSGDGALNYVPVWLTRVEPNITDYRVRLTGKLYLSAAFDLHVQPIDVLLTTTLNSTEQPDSPPPTTGSSGGVGGGDEPEVIRPEHRYYEQFQLTKYSPDGRDRV